MAMTKEDKASIIKEFQKNPADTASAEVQIAILTNKLKYLNDHFKENKKDHHSRRGLMKMVGQRKKFLTYLSRKDSESYKALIAKLGIRR